MRRKGLGTLCGRQTLRNLIRIEEEKIKGLRVGR